MVTPARNPEIDLEKVCFVIIKAHEFDAQEAPVIPDDASDAVDDGFVRVLEAYNDDPTFRELKGFIEAMNEDEQAQLVALAWIGRGDYQKEDWGEAVELARDRHTGSTARYLLGMPLLGDYLAEGLSAFDLTCADTEAEHL